MRSAILALMLLGVQQGPVLEPPKGPKPEAMVDFNAVDLDGRRWNLSSMKGRVTLLDFWGTWCLGCDLDHKYVRDLYSRCHERGLDVLGIVLDRLPIPTLREYLKEKDITWPQVYESLEASDRFRRTFDLQAYPSYVLVERDGSVLATHGGPLGWANDKMMQRLNELCGTSEK